jgi:hypothetical protein
VPGRRLDRQPGLAGPAGAGDGDQPRVAERLDPGELPVASDEARQLRRRPPSRRRVRPPAAQEGQLDGGQLRGGVDSELFGEQVPGVLEDREGLGGPSRRVQGAHELPAEPLPQRLFGHQPSQLSHWRAFGQGQSGFDQVLGRGEPHLLQAGTVGVRVGQVGQCRAAPQVERPSQERGGVRVDARAQPSPPFADQLLETMRVDVVGVDRQPVPDAVELERPGRQVTSQPGDVRLDGVDGAGRRLVAVLAVDQSVHRDHPARVQKQHDQQRTRSWPADGDHLAVGRPHLQGAQDAEPHEADCPGDPVLRGAPVYMIKGCARRHWRSQPGGHASAIRDVRRSVPDSSQPANNSPISGKWSVPPFYAELVGGVLTKITGPAVFGSS